MPLIQVTAPRSSLTKTQQDQFMSRISNAVLSAERAPVSDEGAQSLVWAFYNELSDSDIYVGGKNIKQAPFRIAITTPQGALNESTRTTLVAEIGQIVDEFVGVYENRLNHWTMLYEVVEGSWAGGGQIFPLAGIQQAMNIKST
jgi:phenylpyruvate tautomerase PptA (4-oxalocrotonate tautomerase family)